MPQDDALELRLLMQAMGEHPPFHQWGTLFDNQDVCPCAGRKGCVTLSGGWSLRVTGETQRHEARVVCVFRNRLVARRCLHSSMTVWIEMFALFQAVAPPLEWSPPLHPRSDSNLL